MRKNHQVKPAAVDLIGKQKAVPLTQIELPTNNTRKHIDAAKLKELTASVKQDGVLQPILLRQVSGSNGHAHYQIVAGERRFPISVCAMSRLKLVFNATFTPCCLS